MTMQAEGPFLTYVGPQDIDTNYFQFHVSVNGGPVKPLVMDTGSTGIVINKDLIGGTPQPLSPQPPPPGYSSSGNSYTGQWVQAAVTVTGANGQSLSTTGTVPVFAADQSVFMMGVGIRAADQTPNPFLNLSLGGGATVQAFIVTATGVQFAPTSTDGFSLWSYQGNQDLYPRVTVTLTPPANSGIQPYTETTPVLVDTGIQYMIVTPNTGQPLPDPNLHVATSGQLVPGVGVSVVFPPPQSGPGLTWSFNTSDCGQPAYPALPAYVRFAVPSANGIVNTGRPIIASYDYLIDTANGVIGLRPAQG